MPFTVVEGEDRAELRLFTTSTCAHCERLKELLAENGIKYRYIDLDRMDEKERDSMVDYLDSIYPEWGFPCLLFDNRIFVVGYQEEEIRKLLKLPAADGGAAPVAEKPVSEKVRRIMARLQRFSEQKGASLNPDTAFTAKLINGLLENQERYGYWACPCMLASGRRDEDRDIICPCHYWEDDVKDFGACFCGLFVSQQVIDGEMTLGKVPNRRKKKHR